MVIITGVGTLVYLVPPRNAHAGPIWYRLSAPSGTLNAIALLPAQAGGQATSVDRAAAACSHTHILDSFLLIGFGVPHAEAETQMEAKDQDPRRTEEAYGSRPLPTLDLEMRDIQNDVAVTSSAGPETPRAATVADAGAENDVA